VSTNRAMDSVKAERAQCRRCSRKGHRMGFEVAGFNSDYCVGASNANIELTSTRECSLKRNRESLR
jgi:hypothetical protein